MEKVSVVIPYYNNLSTIERALLSVQSQTYPVWEVIVVDDGSKEYPVKNNIKENFSKMNIRIIRKNENRGGGYARNTGILSATGSWIAHLDADDEWDERHVESFLSLDPDINSLYFCRAAINYPDSSMTTVYMPVGDTPISEYIFVRNGFIPSPSLFLSSELARKFLFNRDRRHTDYNFLLRLDAAGIRFVMSDHVGVIVHWENNTLDAIEKKGGTPQYSLEWARRNHHYFTDKAYAYFLFMNVLVPLLRKGERRAALALMRDENLLPAMKPSNIYRFLSLFLFRRIIKPPRKIGGGYI